MYYFTNQRRVATKKSFKYRIYPTPKQVKALEASLDACRWVYNKTLEVRKQAWEERKKTLTLYDTSSLICKWRQCNPTISDAYAHCLHDAQKRIDNAFKKFFRRVKYGDKPGYPRFRSKDRYDSITYPQHKNGFIIIDNRLKLYKIGSVKFKHHQAIYGIPKTCTISRTPTYKWYAIIVCEVEQPQPLPTTDSILGIDVGLESFATFSTGEKIPNPRFFKTDEHRLVKAQRQLSKAPNFSIKRTQKRKIVARIHEKIANKRSDFAHKLSRRLVNENQTIVFEKLDINQMKDKTFKSIRKSIGDVAWSQFMSCTSYKAEWAGRSVIFVDPRNNKQEVL